MHEWVLDPSAYDLAEAAQRLVDMMFEGLRTTPPRRAPCEHALTPEIDSRASG